MATRAKKSSSSSSKPKALTKSQIASEIATQTGLTKAQVLSVFEAQGNIVAAELKAGRPITLAGLVKVTAQHKAATPARPGRNPFTGQAITIKAKPARKVARVRALKALKDMV